MTYAIDDFLARVRMTAGHLAPVLLTPTEAVALVAEVDRLRAAAQDERAAVVAYLRTDAAIRDEAHGDRVPPCWPAVAVRQMANDIERGDHRPEEEK